MHPPFATTDLRAYCVLCLKHVAREIAIDLLHGNQPTESVLNIVKAMQSFESALRLGEFNRGPRDAQGQLLHDKMVADLSISSPDDADYYARSRAKKLLFEKWFLSESE